MHLPWSDPCPAWVAIGDAVWQSYAGPSRRDLSLRLSLGRLPLPHGWWAALQRAACRVIRGALSIYSKLSNTPLLMHGWLTGGNRRYTAVRHGTCIINKNTEHYDQVFALASTTHPHVIKSIKWWCTQITKIRQYPESMTGNELCTRNINESKHGSIDSMHSAYGRITWCYITYDP